MAKKERTPEQIQAARDRMAKARAARGQRTQAVESKVNVAVADAASEVQCPFCSLYFQPSVYDNHMRLVHGGEMPDKVLEPTPAWASQMPMGATIRTRNSDGTPGIPMKVHWSKKMLEEGWECDDPGCRVDTEGGWRYVPEEGVTDPRCHRCDGPMHKLSERTEWDAPVNAPASATWQGITYWIVPGEINILPDIIVGQIRQSMMSDRNGRVPSINDVPFGTPGRLNQVGIMAPLDEEE